MSDTRSDEPTIPHSPLAHQRASEVCRRFQASLERGEPRIEDFLGEVDEEERPSLLRRLVALEVVFRRRRGDFPRAEEYQRRFPLLEAEWLGACTWPGPQDPAREMATPATVGPRLCCPHCHQPVSQGAGGMHEVVCRDCGSSFRVENVRQASTVEEVRRLGRFQLLERVGVGSFGTVWRARDLELERIVALKVPHSGL
jgi:hypothetical protein